MLRELAQLARALGLGPRGSGFESRVPDHGPINAAGCVCPPLADPLHLPHYCALQISA